MLINLSNHPFEDWDEKQLEVARERWGQIIDLPFPMISPTLTTPELQALAQEYCRECVEMIRTSADTSSAVHLMGEMVFCYNLITLLKAAGITVVASTTEREVFYINNVKSSKFKFVAFREY